MRDQRTKYTDLGIREVEPLGRHRPFTSAARRAGLRVSAFVPIASCWVATFMVQSAGAAQTNNAMPAQNEVGKDKAISGLSVILKVESAAAERIFQAGGYRIKIAAPSTAISFTEPLKRLTDVIPGTWIKFQGTRDESGDVTARTAEFYAAGTRRGLSAIGPKRVKDTPDYQPVMRDSIVDANGHFANDRSKVRFSDAGGPCGWHHVPADAALQERVERIGMRLVPEFQKQLAHDAPSRISFRFYAVDDDKVRSVFSCNAGLILIPKNAVERFQNDDQLAAVLADGIAVNLIRQLFTIPAVKTSAQVAVVLAAGLPALGAADAIMDYEQAFGLAREHARVALQLMDDAGYDPWQAPEAWRLLPPKELPADTQSLEYTPEGKYQLSILELQYKRAADSPNKPSQ